MIVPKLTFAEEMRFYGSVDERVARSLLRPVHLWRAGEAGKKGVGQSFELVPPPEGKHGGVFVWGHPCLGVSN